MPRSSYHAVLYPWVALHGHSLASVAEKARKRTRLVSLNTGDQVRIPAPYQVNWLGKVLRVYYTPQARWRNYMLIDECLHTRWSPDPHLISRSSRQAWLTTYSTTAVCQACGRVVDGSQFVLLLAGRSMDSIMEYTVCYVCMEHDVIRHTRALGYTTRIL